MKLKLTKMSVIRLVKKIIRDPLTYQYLPTRFVPYWLRGFSTEQILYYDLNKDNWRFYSPEIFRYRFTIATNKHVWPILHDKLFFEHFMSARLPIVRSRFFVVAGRFHANQPDYSFSDFEKEVEAGMEFVIKPAQGGGGQGLLFLTSDPDGFKINGDRKELSDLPAIIGSLDYHLIYPLIKSHPKLKEIFPASVNTLRVTAYVDINGSPRLFAPILRVGTSQSAPADNFSQGGLFASIGIDSGICEQTFIRELNGKTKKISAHPESSQKIVGLEIPFWNEIKRTILDFHRDYPSFDLVGWDILIGEKRFYVIEGNHNPEIRMPLIVKNLNQETDLRLALKARNIIVW